MAVAEVAVEAAVEGAEAAVEAAVAAAVHAGCGWPSFGIRCERPPCSDSGVVGSSALPSRRLRTEACACTRRINRSWESGMHHIRRSAFDGSDQQPEAPY